MKTEINNHQTLTVPLEFSVACAVYKLEEQAVLQVFIDHCTIYDSIADAYSKGYSEASKTISLFVIEKRRTANGSDAYRHCLANTANCFKSIADIVNQESETEQESGREAIKRKQAQFYVDELYHTMRRVYTVSDTFYLDENRRLNFSKDFTVLCELHNCYPAEYLENFMSKISIADMQAKTGLKIKNENFTMAFFMRVVKGFGMQDEGVLRFTELEAAFIGKMDEMRLHIHNVRGLQQRTAILKEFYLRHYQNIKA